MASVGSFFSRLFASDAKGHAGNYAEAVGRGSSVVPLRDERARSDDLTAPGLSDSDPASRKS
jgi:hypothetical protein